MDYPSIDYRSPAFGEPALEGVCRILQSRDAEIILFPATGTDAWETAVANKNARIIWVLLRTGEPCRAAF